MEIIDNRPSSDGGANRDKNNGGIFGVNSFRNIYIGLALILIGTVWMLYNLDVINECVFDVLFSWQMLLMLIGGYLLSMRAWLAGAIVSTIGIIFLIADFCNVWIPIGKTLLPAIIIITGISLLLSKRKIK